MRSANADSLLFMKSQKSVFKMMPNTPSSLSVNLPSCGCSLNVSMQMTSSAANLTMAIWSCFTKRGLVFDFSPVFLSTYKNKLENVENDS